MSKKEYYATRRPIDCEPGNIYENEGGSLYLCTDYGYSNDSYDFVNLKSGWKLTAYGVGVYEDGKIDWDYSTGIGFHSYLNKEASTMLRSEFDYLMESNGMDPKEITARDWEKINLVYTWYPDEEVTKEFIVFLISKLGMKVIEDMMPRAKFLMDMEGRWNETIRC